MQKPGKMPFMRFILLFGMVVHSLLVLGGCKTGWEYNNALKQLYRVEENGIVVHARTIKELHAVNRFISYLIGPFGYDPELDAVDVEDPGQLGRESILALSNCLDDDQTLLAEATARFSFLALRAPFDLTRAQAVKAIGKTLDRHFLRFPPVSNPVRKDEPEIESIMYRLIGQIPQGAEEATRPEPLTNDQKLAFVDTLTRTEFKTLQNAAQGLRTFGFLATGLAEYPRSLGAKILEGIHRTGRTVSRMTLVTVLRSEPKPTVRIAAAEALGRARERWAENLLLGLLKRESDSMVLRKVYRSLESFHTSAVVRALLGVLRKKNSQLEVSLARRALIGFTQENLGDDTVAWEEQLRSRGFLKEKTPQPQP